MSYTSVTLPGNALVNTQTSIPTGTQISGNLNVMTIAAGGSTTNVTGSLSLSELGIGVPTATYTQFTATRTGAVVTLTSAPDLTGNRVQLTYNVNTGQLTSVNVQQNTVVLGYQNVLTATNTGTVTQNIACFASGTLIRTSRGEVAVEDLRVGDMAETTSGKSRRIVWLAKTDVDIRVQDQPLACQPVRVAADAFGPGMPHSDLTLSPGHGICVRMLDEVIVPPIVLVNGTTINQLDVDHVSYWHVELESHDILYANGLPAESYINVGNRGFFEEGTAVGVDPVRTLADYCRPYVAEGVLVMAMREQLRLRAELLGWRCETSPFADLHLEADGARVEPVIDGLNARFDLPTVAEEVWLVSAASVPAHVLGSHDTRRLGVLLQGLRIEDREVALDDASLCVGFHPTEVGVDGLQRWTAGRARLPASLWQGAQGALAIGIELAAPPLPKWMAPAQAEAKPLRDGKHLSLVAA